MIVVGNEGCAAAVYLFEEGLAERLVSRTSMSAREKDTRESSSYRLIPQNGGYQWGGGAHLIADG
jgi:hypothetical protein